MSTVQIQMHQKMVEIFTPPKGEMRFRVAHGGRGSGKSFTFALMAAVWGYIDPLRILCTRELQNSIKESMHAEIKNAIQSQPWLSAHYEIGENFIRGRNGTEFIFKGLRHNISSIKSMAQIDLCIVEEAADIPQHSWQALLPTIRAPKSELWIIYNPRSETDPVDVMFRQNTPPRTIIREVNYFDNDWFPTELEEQRRHAERVMSPGEYAWIWEGAYLQHSEAQVFRDKYRIDEFTPAAGWDGPYFGVDFGFAQDPTTGVKAWIANNCLYIEHDFSQAHLELDETANALIEALPDVERHTVRADNARPESISYLKRYGLPRIEPCKKGKGSVEDGVQFIKSFKKVIIHPRCKAAQQEFDLYSYKIDRLSGDILPQLVDANNHVIDALRYALEPIMKKTKYSLESL